jgi:Tfp pilus assembly protein PilN
MFLKEKVDSNRLLLSSIEREIEKPTSPLLVRAAEIEDEATQLESEFNKYATFIQPIAGTQWAEKLTEIQTAIPDDIWLTNIAWQGEDLTLEGFSRSQDSSFRFAESLASSSYIASAQLVSMKSTQKANQMLMNFHIKARLR